MRYRVPRNIVCTSFCSCAIGGMYIFSILLFLYSFSLSHTKHTNKHSFARTQHINTQTQTHYIYLYISLTLSVSISLFIILILFLFFFFFHLFFYRSFTYLPSVFRFFVAAFSYDFISRTIFRSLYFDAFVFFFPLFFFFATFAPLPFFRCYTDDERTFRNGPIKQQTKYLLRYITFPQ